MTEQSLRELRSVTGIARLGVLIYQVLVLPATIGKYLDAQVIAGSARVKPILDNINGTTTTAKSLLDTVSADYYDPQKDDQGFYWDIKNVLDRSSESSFATARLIARLDAQLNGGADPATGLPVVGVIPSATVLLGSLNVVVLQAKDSLSSFDGAMAPLREALQHISGISAELEAELAAGGNLDNVFSRLATAVGGFDKLLEDDSIKEVLANAAASTKSLAGSADTLDIVMRPWRKKAGQLKAILKALAGMLKVVVPLPW